MEENNAGSSLIAQSNLPSSGYEPLPDDNKLKRDKVFLDLANSRVLIGESPASQVSLLLSGSLSDPCHKLRVVITPANAQKEINLEAYSLFEPGKACITVIKPFSVTIPLGVYSPGHYKVYVNGELAGEFDA
jgi:hypothetical protein